MLCQCLVERTTKIIYRLPYGARNCVDSVLFLWSTQLCGKKLLLDNVYEKKSSRNLCRRRTLSRKNFEKSSRNLGRRRTLPRKNFEKSSRNLCRRRTLSKKFWKKKKTKKILRNLPGISVAHQEKPKNGFAQICKWNGFAHIARARPEQWTMIAFLIALRKKKRFPIRSQDIASLLPFVISTTFVPYYIATLLSIVTPLRLFSACNKVKPSPPVAVVFPSHHSWRFIA